MATATSHRDANEFVKCVVVGDPGVGKTCLVCARACDTKYTLQQLVKTHVATVWAIDHYRNDREVLERSWREVDGVPISLRLWDTFGYHDKDRGFAYNRADVVLLCFSTVSPNSLRNVRRVWYPEIKQAIPSTPIVLVGTQVDLRYLYKDEEYLKMNKGLLYRDITENDIISPEQGREVAKEIGAPYYETSVLTHYGVNDVFDNVVRASVCDRRKVRFWNTDLRKLRHPLMQRPMEFPKPKPPKVVVPFATFQDDLSRLLFHQSDCDVIFSVQGNCFQAHKIVLMVAADVFYELFTMDLSDVVISPASTASGAISVKTSATDLSEELLFDEGDDRQKLLLGDEMGHALESYLPQLSGLSGEGDTGDGGDAMDTQPPLPYKEVNLPAFHSVHLQRCDDPYHPGQFLLQTVVTLNSDISPRVFEFILQYLYTGKAREDYDLLEEVKRAAELMGLTNLLVMISSFQTNEAYLNAEAENQFHRVRCSKLRELALEKKLLTDITFEVDDGTVSAHKPLLMARCDMMFAMFSSDFLEASAKLIPFPGISKDTFRALQEYLYTDERPAMTGVDCMDLIEVANRLCLNRLIKLTEEYVVRELNKADEAGEDIMEDVINMLEPAQFLNADQLASYCLFHLGTHFKELTKNYTKLWKGLKLENQIYIDKHRYPPQWYYKEVEMFERARQVSVKRQPRQNFKRQRSSSGCLCFTRRSRVKIQRSMSDDQT